MRKTSLRVLAVLILVVIGAVAWKITHPALTPEQQIELALDNAESALENRSVGGVMSVLSNHFSYDGTSRKEIADALRGAFFQWRDVKLQRTNSSVSVNGDSASTRGNYVLTYRPNLDAPIETQRGTYVLQWRLEDGHWKVVKATADFRLQNAD